MNQYTEFYQLTKPIEIVNPTSSVEKIYGPYTTMELAMASLEILGLPGRLFAIQPTIDSEAELYIYQGKEKPPVKPGKDMVSGDGHLIISDGKIYTNIDTYKQTTEVLDLVFPLRVDLEKDFSVINSVHVGTHFIPEKFIKSYVGYIEILDFTKENTIMALEKYTITIQGTYFIIK